MVALEILINLSASRKRGDPAGDCALKGLDRSAEGIALGESKVEHKLSTEHPSLRPCKGETTPVRF